MQLTDHINIHKDDAKQQFALEVAARLRQAGFEALWAGGCVRDLLLGLEPTDYDIATNARPEQVQALFRRSLAVGASFGVIVVQGNEASGDIEVATFRSDGQYSDGRRPDSVQFCDARNDALRRDFTINGMFFDPVACQVVDYVGGRDDLKNGYLRAIRDPLERFTEDKLRLLRAVRFAARFGLAIDPATLTAIRAMAGRIHAVSVERIAQEFHKMLPHPSRVAGMKLLRQTSLLDELLPEMAQTIGVIQEKPAYPDADVWEHTLRVLELLPGRPGFTLAMGTLLHDVGKPAAMSTEKGRITFYHHETIGRDMANRICRRWKLSNAETQRICWLVEYHQFLGRAMQMKESKIKTILAEPGVDELLDLHEADAMASTGDKSQIDYCRFYLREQPQGPINPPMLISGHDLARLGVKPGPIYKLLLDHVREAQLDRRVLNKPQAIDLALEFLKTQPGDE